MTPDTCGCCEPPAKPTPVEIDNRPGLSAIAYRVGTFSSFRQAMLQAIAGTPELAALRTRLSDDYAITFLELWATVADILTFYQERIANEGFLRTAQLRDSVLRLVRLLDYQLRPGIAATAYLAFTVENGKQVQIPIGLRVQSVPGQDEQPQKFETLEAITADARLNRLRVFPRPQPHNPLEADSTQGVLDPDHAEVIAAALAPADKLVIFPLAGTEGVEEKEVKRLDAIDWQFVLQWSPAIEAEDWTLTGAHVFKWRRKFRLFGYNAPASFLKAEPASAGATELKWTLVKAGEPAYRFDLPSGTDPSSTDLKLDAIYDDLTVGSRLLIAAPDFTQLTRITAISQVAASKGPLSATVTQIIVAGSVQDISDLRQVMLYELVDPEIIFWNQQYPNWISGGTVYVPVSQMESVDSGRTLILDDSLATPQTVTVSETSREADHLAIAFTPALARSLDGKSAVLSGNVALASHGETVRNEVVGDGDAAAAFQRFTLKKKPVTFVPSAGPGGARNSLKLLVNGMLWSEVPSLFGRDFSEPVYTTRIADDGTMTVQFGDGKTGTRPPSGRGNIVATYRQGLGLAGRGRTDSLTTLLDRPVGLRSATNPAPAEGGADPETLDQARQNAPTTVRTFGRAVSLRDFEDLATASGEVAKARVTWVWNGEARTVHLTVAGQQGGTFSTDALARIHASLTARRDPNHPLLLDNYGRVPIVIAATLGVADAYVAAEVAAAARAALLAALSFESLQFGQPIHRSDIYRVLQEVVGVVWVDLDLLHFKDQSAAHLAARGADDAQLQEHLRIYPARPNPNPPPIVLPAEQAQIEVPAEDITILTSGGLPA